ncbi:MAG: hypothetical protein C3F06_09680 [Candidatus Methanoperedenaceae archaeon]|nr:MAG: hypothetical protein C3F06_09680 [Candidatus Methanoperedenaceae archaeon]
MKLYSRNRLHAPRTIGATTVLTFLTVISLFIIAVPVGATLNLAKETTFNSTYTNVIHKLLSSGLKTLIVCPSGCTYSSIQSAIDSASSGDTIEVHSGTYYENVDVNKKLKLKGIGSPVVDAGKNGSAITLFENGVILEGFTTIGSTGSRKAGIKVTSSNNILINNTAHSNQNGIYLQFSSNNQLIGNTASWNNGIFDTNNGILLSNSNNNILSANTASYNGEDDLGGYGIYLKYSNNNTLSNNSANLNYNDGGIYLKNSGNNKLNGNTAFDNSHVGITLEFSSNNNMLSGNIASSNDGYGFGLLGSDNNTMNDNNAYSNSEGIYLEFSSNNTLSGNIASNNGGGLYISNSNNNMLSSNKVLNSGFAGILIMGSSSNNKIYNNIFNNVDNYFSGMKKNTTWNTTMKSGTNIIGGPIMGGNFWAYLNGTGFSQTCTDANNDGICDAKYTLDSNNIDYLPLAATRLTVISPNDGETWMQNKSYKIKWISTGATGSFVKIRLLKNGTAVKTIKSNTSNDGSYRWKIPYSIVPGTDYKIRIISKSNPAYKDSSDKKFAIIEAV